VGNVTFVDEGSVTCVDIDNVWVSVETMLCYMCGWMQCYMCGWMQCYMSEAVLYVWMDAMLYV